MSDSSSPNNTNILRRLTRAVDGFISPAIRAQGAAERARAGILIAQSIVIAASAVFSATYQASVGRYELAALALLLLCAVSLVPLLIRRAESPVWVGGVMTGALFGVLTAANIVTAGRGITSTFFLATVPLMGTLTQGLRWGVAWSVLSISELAILYVVVRAGIEPMIPPSSAALEYGYLRSGILVTLVVAASGLLHGVFNDFAARRVSASESHIARSRKNYREMLDTSPDGLFSVSSSGHIDFANRTLYRMLGHSNPKAILGMALSDFLHGADVALLRTEFPDRDLSTTMECEVRLIDDTSIAVEVATTHIYVYGDRGQVFRLRDIRRFRRASLEAQILRSAFEQAPMGVAVLEMDSEVIYANDAYLEMIAFTRGELMGQKLLDVTRSDESREILREIQAALERGETVSVPKMDWHRFGARPSFVDVRSFSIQPPGETRRRWVTFIRDVTHLVDLEREVARSERIDSLGKLAGGIAHDFNNLLTVIMGQVDILDEDLEWDHWGREYLSTIMDACERSAALTSKVLDFSRKQALRPSIFLADDAVRGMLPILRQLVPERINLEVVIQESLEPRVRCDPSRFEQILLNLVANARDAISESGTISIHIRAHARINADSESNDEIEIEVRDNGCGMSAAVQNRIFEPFYTTKAVGDGTGLGLSTVHGIVHQSGGRLELESAEGQGSKFHVYLPATDEDLTETLSTSIKPRTRIHGNRGLVLVVEDNPAVRALVTRSIERLGFGVVAAQNGAEARRWVEDRTQNFEALVSDVVMPGTSGVEVARIFRSRFADKRIVLMSGYAEEEIGPMEGMPSDIRFAQKPLTSQMLSEALMS